ncbi:MAG: two-component system nitrogen regulation sensor histidine kinase GlnL [Arenicella sp.]|jgi:two-component system nitrogen regulation sensor histidine kinase GlnL
MDPIMHKQVPTDTLLENLEAALILISHDLVVQRVNIAAETLFEQSRRTMVGKNIVELLPSTTVAKCLDDCLASNSQFTLREVGLSVTSSLVDMTISPLIHEDRRFILIEINSIKRISRFIKETNQLERQQSFRMMMRGLAHEIKNPLGGIRGAAQLLDRELDDSGHQQLTDILIKEADRLTQLVDRVMGSREQFKLLKINIHEVLEHVAGLVLVKSSSRSLKLINKLAIERHYDPALPEINADKQQLIQAVLNIVGNAIEAQVESSSPRIGLITQFERFVTINQILHRQALKIKIWDDGPGIEKHMRDIIFDPLVTGRPTGSGLGLSITQEIIQRHQGVVQLEDFEGKTCFAIYLPYT